MSEPRVRVYEEADREAVVALWSASFPDDPPWNAPEELLDRKLAVQPELVLIAERQGETVGAVMGGYDGVRGWMYHLATAATHRRQGIATSLVTELERRLVDKGCQKVNLQIREGNADIAGFYRALGYAREPRLSLGKRLDGARREAGAPRELIAAIFSSEMGEVSEEYSVAATEMETLAQTIFGYVGHESYREGSRAITVSYWDSEEAIGRWRNHPRHLEVQSRGRRDWYDRYTLRVARVLREGQFKGGAGVPLGRARRS